VGFSHGRFNANVRVIHTGSYLATYSTNAARLRYKNAFRNTSASLSWAFDRRFSFYIDGYNVLSEPQSYYYGVPEHLNQHITNGMVINLGVRGRF